MMSGVFIMDSYKRELILEWIDRINEICEEIEDNDDGEFGVIVDCLAETVSELEQC